MTTHEPVDRQLPGDQAGDEVKNDTLYRSQQDKRLLGIRIPSSVHFTLYHNRLGRIYTHGHTCGGAKLIYEVITFGFKSKYLP